MIHSTDTLGQWKFNQTLIDDANNLDFVSSGTAQYNTFSRYDLLTNENVSQYGLEFQSGVTYSAGNSFSIISGSNYELFIAFWWYSPSWIGYTKHPISKYKQTYYAPLISKATSTIASGIETVTAGEFIVSEISGGESQNAIQVALCSGGTIPTNLFVSEPYDPGLRHIVINYSGDSTTGWIRIDIDGKRGTTVQANSSIPNTVGELRLNDTSFGYTSLKSTQVGGIMSDLLIRRNVFSDSGISTRGYQFGQDYLTYEELITKQFSFFGLSYPQSCSISTKHTFVDGGRIYVGRSNGKILCGSSPIWDTEFLFEDPATVNRITVTNEDDVHRVEQVSSGIKVIATSIRV